MPLHTPDPSFEVTRFLAFTRMVKKLYYYQIFLPLVFGAGLGHVSGFAFPTLNIYQKSCTIWLNSTYLNNPAYPLSGKKI